MKPCRYAAGALIFLLASSGGRAAGQEAPFELIQHECVAAGKVSAAALKRWGACRVDHGRWFSTIELDDFYQAQYCLLARSPAPGKGSATATGCRQQALLLFANRAYTPTARLTLERVDPAGTAYDDPQVLLTSYGYVLTLTVRRPRAAAQTSYYRWRGESWEAIETRSWQDVLTGQLPAGSRIGPAPVPDFESMRSRLAVFRPGDAPCCPSGVAEVEFELSGARLAIKAWQLASP